MHAAARARWAAERTKAPRGRRRPHVAGSISTPAAPSSCHPSYDPCVPYASDVDCAGGSGNGPAYTGQVRIIGYDEYGLDADGDGVGCE